MISTANVGQAGAFMRQGLAVFLVGLAAGLGMILYHAYAAPAGVCSISSVDVGKAWPWAGPLLAVETAALVYAALGALLLLTSTPNHKPV